MATGAHGAASAVFASLDAQNPAASEQAAGLFDAGLPAGIGAQYDYSWVVGLGLGLGLALYLILSLPVFGRTPDMETA